MSPEKPEDSAAVNKVNTPLLIVIPCSMLIATSSIAFASYLTRTPPRPLPIELPTQIISNFLSLNRTQPKPTVLVQLPGTSSPLRLLCLIIHRREVRNALMITRMTISATLLARLYAKKASRREFIPIADQRELKILLILVLRQSLSPFSPNPSVGNLRPCFYL